MDALTIDEVGNLKVYGFTLTWSTMIDNMSTRCWQSMEALYHVRDFLEPRSFTVALKAFERTVCDYGSVTPLWAFNPNNSVI